MTAEVKPPDLSLAQFYLSKTAITFADEPFGVSLKETRET
jgi:hypothetical protein